MEINLAVKASNSASLLYLCFWAQSNKILYLFIKLSHAALSDPRGHRSPQVVTVPRPRSGHRREMAFVYLQPLSMSHYVQLDIARFRWRRRGAWDRVVVLPGLKAFCLLAAACALSAPNARAGEVKVAVAANFTEAAKAIGAAFEKATGHKAIFSFGSTG